jgi:hypothetical protein
MIGGNAHALIYQVHGEFAPFQRRRALYSRLYNARGSSSVVRQFAGAEFSSMR